MPKIEFPSAWLKIGKNIEVGDNIRFLNAGNFDEKKEQWVFLVGIVKGGKVVEQKQFTLNKTNFDAIEPLYGDDSDNWLNKEMKIELVKARNPQTGTFVDSILLVKPE